MNTRSKQKIDNGYILLILNSDNYIDLRLDSKYAIAKIDIVTKNMINNSENDLNNKINLTDKAFVTEIFSLNRKKNFKYGYCHMTSKIIELHHRRFNC
jgi:hypothetical protein